MNEPILKIGDRIKDIEDGDCYYIGIVTSIDPIKYRIETIIWNDEIDNSMNGQEIEPKWWYIELD